MLGVARALVFIDKVTRANFGCNPSNGACASVIDEAKLKSIPATDCKKPDGSFL